MTKTLQQRFDAKYIIEPGGCWRWKASLNRGGYGQIFVGSRIDGTDRMAYAHRVSWELHNGRIPPAEDYHGTCVLHRCDKRSCVNPDHLFLGTNADNVADRDMKGRGRNGGLCGEAHGCAKLTDAHVVEIRMLAGTMLQREIAGQFGVSEAHVSGILSGQRR